MRLADDCWFLLSLAVRKGRHSAGSTHLMLLFHSDNNILRLLVFWSALIISIYAFDISIFLVNAGLYYI